MNENIIIRYTAPTKYDDGLYGQICRSESEDSHKYYIQTSKIKKENKWIPMGDFLEHIFRNKFNDEHWVNKCLQDYE